MRNKLRRVGCLLGVVLLLVGGGILLYPKFTAWRYAQGVEKQRTQFVQRVESGTEASNLQLQLEQLYQELSRQNQTLFENHQAQLVDPFSYEQPDIDLSQYGLEDGVIGFLSIEKMQVQLPIYLGANQHNMTLGAAHMTNTSYPIGGENTNCVLAAHRGYAKAPMFRNIQLLEVGDVVELQNFRETLRYEVSEISVVLPTDLDCLSIREGEDLLTLITCHPYPTNTYRYVVTCTRTE